jgi:tRNA pseudouridine32 synthase/23S rRNA pseudouridine746 synthase
MFEILHQDADLLVVNKPENLLCVPGLCNDDNLFDRVRRDWPNARVVHRLDMATSGIILFALNHTSQAALGRQFELRQVIKRYSALLQGQLQDQCGEIDLPLLCDWPNRPRQKVDWQQGKHAHTLFEVVERGVDRSHVRLYPLSGRSHQLRVHCQQLGHPILGDKLYGDPNSAERLMLHAESISFLHPRTQVSIQINCPAPFASTSNLSSSKAICP